MRSTDQPYTEAFATVLRERCAELELGATDLGALLGVTRQQAHRLLQGERAPTIGRLCTLADLLELTTDELLGRKARSARSRRARAVRP